MFLTGGQGVGGPEERYGRRTRPDKKEPLRAGERIVACVGRPAVIRCAPRVVLGYRIGSVLPRRAAEAPPALGPMWRGRVAGTVVTVRFTGFDPRERPP
ncbi:hypothetical protein GCM10010308_67630 [Streptomyces vinaceusdrappus]|nr:hypothetical protein GCM10010301_65740 [Streptomyces plicatus]GHC39258.1 hypothetical protein GCM10010308_67630 [Streptomyces vinaceusdrappus]